MSDLYGLVERQEEDSELVPEILPLESRLSLSGPTDALKKMFSAAVSVTPDKEIIKNTTFVLLEAFEGTNTTVDYCQVSATDGDRSLVRVEDRSTTHLSGSALLPGKKILDILRVAPADTVRIDVSATNATIRSGRALWTVATPVGDALPPFPDMSEVERYPVDASSFRNALTSVLKAVATSTARLSLMQIHVSQGKLTACDGARVHRVEIDTLSKNLDTTIPSNLAAQLLKELAEFEEETMLVGASSNTVAFYIGKNTLMGQRMTVEYPNIDHLMLEPALLNTDILKVRGKELYETVKRVRINSDPEFHALTLSLRKLKGEWILVVSSRDKSKNASQESIKVEYEGSTTSHSITTNHRYLTSLLECVGSGEVEFRLGESTKTKKSPVLVIQDGFSGVIQPMVDNFMV